MKTSQIYIFFILVLNSACLFSQEFEKILIPLDSSLLIPNPRQKEINEAYSNHGKAIQNRLDSGLNIYTTPETMPIFYHLSENGDTTFFNNNFSSFFKGKTQNKIKAFFQLHVDWRGEIVMVALIKSEGKLDDINFLGFFQELRAKPAKAFGIPYKQTVNIPIYIN